MGRYYYETIKVTVQKTEYYTFHTTNPEITYSYIYQNSFNPFNPDENILVDNGTTCGQNYGEFKIYLHVNITYILVMTTRNPNAQGNFSVLVTGPSNVIFNRTSEYYLLLFDECYKNKKDIFEINLYS